MAATRVLVIEDDERVAAFVRRGLEEEAYVVDVASDGETGLAHALRDHVDLMVLDVMLPGMSGFEVLRRLRREGRRMPVLLLTARNARRDVVEGLDAGADDYLTKPFDFEELLARLRALTRRAHPPDETLLRFADVELNRLDRVARRGEQVLPLTPTEFRLLEVMMVEPEAVISRTELLERVWGMRFDPGTSLIDVHTANLRRKLEEGGAVPNRDDGQGSRFQAVQPVFSMSASSFRTRLAMRFGLLATLLSVVGAGATYVALRYVLYGRLDTVLQRIGEIEAAAAAHTEDSSVHFHEAVFGDLGAADRNEEFTRFAQVWTLDGEPVERTSNLNGEDLPFPPSVRVQVRESSEPVLHTVSWHGGRYRSYVFPLVLVGEQHGPHLLQVVASTRETEAVLANAARFLGIMVLIGCATGVLGGWWLAGHAVRPVLRIIREAEAVEAGAPRPHITAHSDTRELSRLINVLNAMLGRIQDAVEAQRRFLADAGHSIKTPLTVVRGDIDVTLRRPRPAEEYERTLRQVLLDLKDTSGLAEDLITLARSDGGETLPEVDVVDLSGLVEQIGNRFRSEADTHGLTIELDIEAGLRVWGDAILLDRAVSNLIDNAVKYGRNGTGGVKVSVRHTPAGVEVRVRDHGPGVDQDELPRLFERFYRGEVARRHERGSGLGLSIAKAIVETHGGDLDLESGLGDGTTVRLLVPAAGEHVL